ncbi:hypothetical protein [Mesorhizobium sp. M9A.F.Ca.ET.002.03.1.2]|uniref:hypothetical protein n=1 Tax=Mesorhizobium sp. M9A.F.Ca.ET.002.03.1.2 TaxID=2493668 RepID=UPI001673FE84|nr:hypothetical protein [Mesorhizobium sp. M9A.F.Ca.ET.002.03.1.2]
MPFADLGGPATITIGADNNGEIAFGALQAGLNVNYSPSMVFFTWGGCDEMDEVSSELLDDGSIEITFAYHNGDEAILKATKHFFNSLLELWRAIPLGTLLIDCVSLVSSNAENNHVSVFRSTVVPFPVASIAGGDADRQQCSGE